MKRFAFLIPLIAFSLAGCTRKNKEQGRESIEQLIEKGWHFFENNFPDSAYFAFSEAVALNPSLKEAWLGLAWASLKLYDLSFAHESFLRVLNMDSSEIDAYAGLSIADSDPVEDASLYGMTIDSVLSISVHSAEKIKEIAPHYVFVHDTVVTLELIRLCEARSYCSLADFEKALLILKEIEPDFNADITTPEGRFLLIQEIERLIDLKTQGAY